MKKLTMIGMMASMAVLLSYCSPKAGKQATSGPSDTETAAAFDATAYLAKFDAGQIEEGKNIYMASCNKCHGYKKPESKPAEKWPKTIERMGNKAKLTQDQKNLVLAYVVANAKKQ
jgi:cytochrome c5